jgi:hypothetical protein
MNKLIRGMKSLKKISLGLALLLGIFRSAAAFLSEGSGPNEGGSAKLVIENNAWYTGELGIVLAAALLILIALMIVYFWERI